MARTPDAVDMLVNPDRYYKNAYRKGLWRAEVVSVKDPENRGRIQVRILHLHPASSITGTGQELSLSGLVKPQTGIPDGYCPWAEPAFPFGGSLDNGFLMLPKVGSTVWIGFEMGFTGNPVWLGAWYGGEEVPIEFESDPENIRMIRTPHGHTFLFSDQPNAECVYLETKLGHTVFLNDQGGNEHIQIRTAAGHEIFMDDKTGVRKIDVKTVAGHRILMDDLPAAPKIDVKTVAGHEILLDDTAGGRKIDAKTVAGHEIKIDDQLNMIVGQLAGGTQKIEIFPTQVKLTSGAVTLLMDASTGVVTINCVGLAVTATGPGAAVTISGGQVKLGDGAVFDGVALGSALAGLFNAHKHSGVQPGLSDTGAPTTTMTPGTHYSMNVTVKP